MSLSNQEIATFLRRIPQSNHNKETLQNTYPIATESTDIAILYGIARMLKMFGVIQLDDKEPIGESLIQASSQTAKYTLMSFADYFEREATMIKDWETRGIQNSIFSNGATFLHRLEQDRLERFEDTIPSRYVKVAQVLIKRINPDTNEHELLFQFDANANQYQLIGGRWSEKDGNNLQATIIREIEEELPLNNIPYPESYQLNCLIDNLIIDGEISNTFGALTHYTFWIFHMIDLTVPLDLQPEDLWIPIQMVLSGIVKVDGKDYPFTSPEIYRRIDQSLANGLMGLPVSFAKS
jgi:8-oxo-dGTP pyrophosphatase MutT (NUDIX family)